jgi:hypothetical protein
MVTRNSQYKQDKQHDVRITAIRLLSALLFVLMASELYSLPAMSAEVERILSMKVAHRRGTHCCVLSKISLRDELDRILLGQLQAICPQALHIHSPRYFTLPHRTRNPD